MNISSSYTPPAIDVSGVVMFGSIVEAIHRASMNDDFKSQNPKQLTILAEPCFGPETYEQSIGILHASAAWSVDQDEQHEDSRIVRCRMDSSDKPGFWLEMMLSSSRRQPLCNIRGNVGGYRSRFVGAVSTEGMVMIRDLANPMVHITHQIPEHIWSVYGKDDKVEQ